MKILIITPYAEPEKGACVVRVNAFREFFTQSGHEVCVLAPGRAGVGRDANVERYGSIVALMKKIAFGKFDAVIGTSPPITHNFFGLLAAKAAGAKFLLDAKDPFTEIMKKMHPEKEGTPKFRLFELIESFTHKNADRVMFLCTPYLESARAKFGLPAGKVFLAPNGTDTEKIYFDPAGRKKIRKELGLGAGPVIAYIGGLGDEDTIGFCEESFPALAKRHGAKAVFIISYEDTPTQREILAKMKGALAAAGVLQSATFLFSMPFENLYKYLSACDVGLVPYPNFEMNVVVVKAYDCIAAGLPIAVKALPDNSEITEFVESNGTGFVSSSWGEFNSKFSKMASQKLPARGRIADVAKKYTREEGAKAILAQIERLLG